MFGRYVRFSLFCALASLTILFASCDQPNDVLTGVSQTRLKLTTERLPSNPAGTVYQLWVADENDTALIATFSWDFDTRQFYNAAGDTLRPDSNTFSFDGDALAYDEIMMSVEVLPDANPLSPGAIMLIDTIQDPNDGPVRMRFPLVDSLWNSLVAANFETPSDSERTENDGYGVWFSGYKQKLDSLRDTLSIISYTIAYKPCDSLGGFQCDSIVVDSLINFRPGMQIKVIGLDTFVHAIVRFDSAISYDATFPFTRDSIDIEFDLVPDSGIRNDYIGDEFGQPSYDVSRITKYGWKYRGWVMSPVLNGGCSNAAFSAPAWISQTQVNEFFPQNGSAMISTGSFATIDSSDLEANSFTLGSRTPKFPGEDFLQGLPCASLPAGGFIPDPPRAAGLNGCVFVSVEPLGFSSGTNFPLIAFAGNIPTNRGPIFPDTSEISTEVFLRTLTQTVPTDLIGFPAINVEIDRP